MRSSDWSSDVCSSDLGRFARAVARSPDRAASAAALLHRRAGRHLRRLFLFFRSDLRFPAPAAAQGGAEQGDLQPDFRGDRKSVVWGKRVSVRVDLGGRRLIKKKIQINQDDITK